MVLRNMQHSKTNMQHFQGCNGAFADMKTYLTSSIHHISSPLKMDTTNQEGVDVDSNDVAEKQAAVPRWLDWNPMKEEGHCRHHQSKQLRGLTWFQRAWFECGQHDRRWLKSQTNTKSSDLHWCKDAWALWLSFCLSWLQRTLSGTFGLKASSKDIGRQTSTQ